MLRPLCKTHGVKYSDALCLASIPCVHVHVHKRLALIIGEQCPCPREPNKAHTIVSALPLADKLNVGLTATFAASEDRHGPQTLLEMAPAAV